MFARLVSRVTKSPWFNHDINSVGKNEPLPDLNSLVQLTNVIPSLENGANLEVSTS